MKENKLYSRHSLTICIISGLFLILFSGYKACFDSFTHDESITWIEHMHRSVWNIITYQYASANNHLLNSLLMKASSGMLGNGEFALRLPEWLAHIVYIFFTIKVLQLLKNPWLIMPGFMLLNFNPYLLDFFSIARGYGMALAFMMGSIYFLIKYIWLQRRMYNVLTFLFAFLSILANLTWINFYLTLFVGFNFFNLIVFLKRQATKKSFLAFIIYSNIPGLIWALCAYVIFRKPVKEMNATNQFFFGGNQGFWTDTAYKLVRDSLYTTSSELLTRPALVILVATLALLATYLLINLLYKGFNNAQQPVYVIMVMLFIAGFSSYLQHIWLGTLFLMDRTSLLFIPMVMLCIVYFFDYAIKGGKWIWVSKILASGFALVLFVHFILVFNLTSVHEYAYDANTKNMLIALDNYVPQNDRKPEGTYIGAPWVFRPTINFYRDSKNMTWVRHLEPYVNDKLSAFDYMYVFNVDETDRSQYKKDGKLIVAEFPETKSALVKWK